MSLIIARIVEDEIRIISDSKITNPTAIRSWPMTDALKALVLRPDLCVCFAGNVRKAEKALEWVRKELQTEDYDLSAILQLLVRASVDGESGIPITDFIVATLRSNISIHMIKDGRLESNVRTAWIGDYDAFCAFQEYCNSPDVSRLSLAEYPEELKKYVTVTNMTEAFRRVLSDSRFPSVDNFLISVTSRPAGATGFAYLASANMEAPGTSAQGGYSYSILPSKCSGIAVIGLYFNQGQFGALIYPQKYEDPIIYPRMTMVEFIKKVMDEHNIDLWRFGFEGDGSH